MKRVTCPVCGHKFEAKRSTAKYCSATCRTRARRAPDRDDSGRGGKESPFEAATRRELKRLGKVESMLGQQALAIARRMGNGAETGSAIATLSKEHSRLMGALTSSGGGGDPVDEVRQRREQKKAAARSPAG